MGWFGSLDLAYKYALVFGSALAMTLILGFIKLLADRRRMKKLMRDVEAVPGRKATIDHGQSELNMREKDEGDLFGIRAIEAGFYGGVAQSTPNSAVNSPAGSRCASPAPGKRTPQGHSPSSSITVVPSRPPTSSNLSHSKNLSDSVSTLTHESNRPEFMQGNHLRSTSHNSGIAVRHPLGQSTLGHTQSPKLLPSQAELSGRIKHAPIDTPLDVPPFPAPATHSSEQEYPRSSHMRASDDSFVTSMSPYHSGHLDESRSPLSSTLSMATHIGTGPFTVVPLNINHHSDVDSMQLRPQGADTQAEPLSNPPGFPKNATINSTPHSPGESSFARDLDGVLAENRRGHFNNRESSLPPPRSAPAYDVAESSYLTTGTMEDHRRLRRTSVSFAIDAYDSDSAVPNAPTPTMNVGKFKENQNQGTYQPKGIPFSRKI